VQIYQWRGVKTELTKDPAIPNSNPTVAPTVVAINREELDPM
jgi:hypothetical protein